MALVMLRYRYNKRHHDLQSLIGQEKSSHGSAHPTAGH
jgi:hypothetical protein